MPIFLFLLVDVGMEAGTQEWFSKLEKKIDHLTEVSVRTEAKFDALKDRTSDNEDMIKALDNRMDVQEQKSARNEGSIDMLFKVGGLLVGIAIIATAVVTAIALWR